MHETLNEIVQEQGENMNKIESNVTHAKVSASHTIKELSKVMP
jgi:t-SNARE complex subunit (syntaxin)